MLASPIPRASLLYVVKTLPAAPQIMARLAKLLLNLDASLEDIVELLRRDCALTALVIRVANSVAYSSPEPFAPFASLEEALARVGLSEAYRLTGMAAVAQLSERSLPFYGISGARLRENSLLTGLVAESCAPAAGIDPRMAYTAGLLRSTGKIALDRLTRDRAYGSDFGRKDGVPLAEWETGFVGLSNGEAAAIILEAWHFPERTVMAICDHYAPTPQSPPLAWLLNLAAGAVERCGFELPGENSYWAVTPEKLAQAGIEGEGVREATRRALEVFGPIRTALG